MCSNPYLNIFQLYYGFKGSKQTLTLWGCLCEQTLLQCFLSICTMCLDHTFQFSVFNIQTFQFFKFQIPSRHFTNGFQISVFNFQLLVFTHPNSDISVSKFSNQDASHRDFNFQFLVLNIHTSQFKHFSSQNFRFQTFDIQLSNFSFQYSNISVFKILDSKHFIYCSTLVGLAHASEKIN